MNTHRLGVNTNYLVTRRLKLTCLLYTSDAADED